MRINSQQISYLILMIMMIILTVSINLSSCRKLGAQSNYKATAKGPATSRFHSQFSWYKFPAQAPKESSNLNNKQDYRVSNRVIPAGPNPLHN
ncbi:hypothetical protein CASFOL_010583 [Castilleja foliolosa]|uniref:Clavata3/ESR (CLE) gene family member n=1 Tax=Castilleja foliolosa TaxID=1961234 RepID=A0ABD3DT10_9LAMI